MKLISKLQNITIWTKTSKVSKSLIVLHFQGYNKWVNIYWFEFIKGKGTRKKKHSAKITFKNGRQIYHPYRRHEEQSEKSRDEQPHLGPLVLLFPISQTYCSVSLFLSLFFLLTCQANKSDPRDLLLQGPSNPIKAFQLN